MQNRIVLSSGFCMLSVDRAWIVCLMGASCLLMACRQPLGHRPPPGVDVQHYDLAIQLDPASRLFQARAILDVAHPDTLSEVVLALETLTVDSVWVNGQPVRAVHREGRLHIPVEEGLLHSRIAVRYQGWPQRGLHVSRYGGQEVVYTSSWPDEGRGWLPGFHHPADPATLALALTVPLRLEAAASGTLQALDTLGATVRYRWQLQEPVPLYAFAFAVSDFSLTEDAVADTLPIHYYMLAEDSASVTQLRRTPQALAYFSETFGPYPFDTYASVQVPMGFAGMENASASFLMADLFKGTRAEAVQVHEVAHQWFGNRVPIADWPDLWLSEGTATYLTTLFYEQVDGLDEARRRWVDMAALTPARRLQPLVVPTNRAPSLTWIPYDKGASVLHLLRSTLGDEAFFDALRHVYQHYAARPLSTTAFQEVLETTARRNLDALFQYWVYGEDVPRLETTWDAASRTLSWNITGDAGTLAGVPFELQIRQNNRLQYVDVQAGRLVVPTWDVVPPDVRSVGVMMHIE